MLKPDVLINKDKGIYVPDMETKANKDKAIKVNDSKYNIGGKCIKIIK